MFFCREKNIKEELNVLSWNLDGLEEDYRTERTNAAIKIIIEKKPDVVLHIVKNTLLQTAFSAILSTGKLFFCIK